MKKLMKKPVVYIALGIVVLAALEVWLFRTPGDMVLKISPGEVFEVKVTSPDFENVTFKKGQDDGKIAELSAALSGEYTFAGHYKDDKNNDGGGFETVTFYGEDGEIIKEVGVSSTGLVISGKHLVFGRNMFMKQDGVSVKVEAVITG